MRDDGPDSFVTDVEDGITGIDGIADVEADMDIVADGLRELEPDPARALPRALEGLRGFGTGICCSVSDAVVRSMTLLCVPAEGVEVGGTHDSGSSTENDEPS